MADKKISALTASTVPLAGTEVLPIVQGGDTVKVPVSDLTAGRAVAALNLALSGGSTPALDMGTSDARISFMRSSNATGGYFSFYDLANSATRGYFGYGSAVITGAAIGDTCICPSAGGVLRLGNPDGSATNIEVGSLDTTFWRGNLVQGTAAKGINFTANTPAAGMTSQLLNWYEEGTWTPNQGAGLTVVGAFSSNGTYVRIGRSITVKGQVLGATTVAVAAAGVISTNLPFAAASGHAGSMYNAAITVGGAVAITTSSATAADAIAATPSITFTATYQM